MKIVYVDEQIPSPVTGETYAGMNWYAAQELKVDFPHDKGTIVLWKGLTKKGEKWCIEHESREIEYMKKGLSYNVAHLKALLDSRDYKSVREAIVGERQYLINPTHRLPKDVATV